MVKGCVAVASRKWWELSPVELVLLSQLVTSLPQCSSRDIPVFLPKTSPKVRVSSSYWGRQLGTQFKTNTILWPVWMGFLHGIPYVPFEH